MKAKFHPFFWGALVMVLAMALTFVISHREQVFVEEHEITSPDVSLVPIIAYFFGVVIVMGVIFAFIPLDKLRLVFRILFAFMFGWGVFIVAALNLPTIAAYILAIIAFAAWLFWGRVWLHDLLLLVTLSAAGSVFGFIFSPLTFMIFMGIVAVYDIIAVRLGFMVWMADKLSDSDALPAFIFPRRIKDFMQSLRNVRVGELTEKDVGSREYSILGGGDIGFPLMLAVSVYFKEGLPGGVVVGGFALIGLMGAFLIQLLWLKDKPVPALPTIALTSLIGFLIAQSVF